MKRKQYHTCKCCGKQFPHKNGEQRNIYCSRKCSFADICNRVYEIVCIQCGKEFKSGGNVKNQKCNECKTKIKNNKEIEKNYTCQVCNKEFLSKTKRKYCTDKCRYSVILKTVKEKYKPVEIVFENRTCIECGTTFEAGTKTAQKYCGKKCREKESKRNANLNRRAKKKKQFKEKVHRKQIYERDGGICQICHSKKPIDLKLKAPDPLSATIDHIHPLSKGGTHEPSNCQLAHFLCNSKKSDNLIDSQFKLAL